VKKRKMKTKNKIIVLLEIAIVLCSLFLVALPTIAAEQTTQEVSACTVTTASEDDYVLGIYGNANEDDTIDMRDLTYVKLIFFGKKPETELADAKYDGKINPLDFIQIKLIIVGKEKELTVVDSADRIVTLDMPIERVVVTEDKIGEVIRILGIVDTVVGIDPNMAEVGYFPVMGDKPHVGNCVQGTLDYELIAELDPDLVIINGHYGACSATIEPLERIGMKVIAVENFFGSGAEGEPIDGRAIDLTADNFVHCFRTLGIIFNKDERAQEFLDWRTNKLEMIMERTEDLEEDEILDAFLGFPITPPFMPTYQTIGDGRKEEVPMDMAGLHNIAEVYGTYKLDPEWILENDPDVIFMTGYWRDSTGGYKVTDPSEIEELIKAVSQRLEFKSSTAVKNGRVYVINGECLDIRPWIGAAYMSKVAYPERFEDINPDEIADEYFEEWLRVPYQGIHFYPAP
jgi:iron complex transport system substrate-binding protein